MRPFCHFWPKIANLWGQYKRMANFELGKNAESGLTSRSGIQGPEPTGLGKLADPCSRLLKVENSIFSSIVVRFRYLFANNALKDAIFAKLLKYPHFTQKCGYFRGFLKELIFIKWNSRVTLII